MLSNSDCFPFPAPLTHLISSCSSASRLQWSAAERRSICFVLCHFFRGLRTKTKSLRRSKFFYSSWWVLDGTTHGNQHIFYLVIFGFKISLEIDIEFAELDHVYVFYPHARLEIPAQSRHEMSLSSNKFGLAELPGPSSTAPSRAHHPITINPTISYCSACGPYPPWLPKIATTRGARFLI